MKTYTYVNDKKKFHRIDGPAIKHSDGTKEWYIDGKLHREDGPAVEYADGRKDWFLNGQLHREDGPAIEMANGDKQWFLNSQRHREDGPAVEYTNGDKQWWLNGHLHREDGPAIEYHNVYKQWYRNGQLHREDGPAVEFANGDKEWWINGEYHREDGPAVEYINGDKEWWVNGKLHREDGPAIEYANGSKGWYLNGLKISEPNLIKTKKDAMTSTPIELKNGTFKYYLDSKLHREDGPAIIQKDGTKKWYINGKLHREDGPAIEWANGHKEYYLKGEFYNWESDFYLDVRELKRERKRKEKQLAKSLIPAVGAFTHKEGNYLKHYFNGVLHRTDGPAVENKNGSKEWYYNGKRHREDGPAIERSNGSKEWYYNGKRHREDGPALERNPASVESYASVKEWYKNGKLHNEDGPACIAADGYKIYALNGEAFYSKREFNAALKKYKLTHPSKDKIKLNEVKPESNESKTELLKVLGELKEYKPIIPLQDQHDVDALLDIIKNNSLNIDNSFLEEHASELLAVRKHADLVEDLEEQASEMSATQKRDALLDVLEENSPYLLSKDFSGFEPISLQKEFTLNNENLNNINNNNQTKETKMSKQATFMDTLKADAERAAYRVAATQMTNGVKAAMIAAMKDRGGTGPQMEAIRDLMESKFGNALVSGVLGYSLAYVPQLKDDPRVQKLSEEFRVEGMATIGNEIISTFVQYLTPAVMDAIKNLPPVQTAIPAVLKEAATGGKKRTRIADETTEEIEEETEVSAPATATA